MKATIFASWLLLSLLSACQSSSSLQTPAAGPTQRQSTEKASFSADFTARLFVNGMSCPLCATNINKQLMRVPGVQDVSVNLGSGLVMAKLSPGNPPTREQLAEAIKQSGFTLDRIEMPEVKGANHD